MGSYFFTVPKKGDLGKIEGKLFERREKTEVSLKIIEV